MERFYKSKGEIDMPMVNGKKYAYTKAGMKKAAEAKKKKKKKANKKMLCTPYTIVGSNNCSVQFRL